MENTIPQNFGNAPLSPAYVEMVRKMARDMKFTGIFAIVYGALTCLGIISAVIGIPTIIAGIRLKDSADMYKNYIANNDFAALANAFELQSRFFFITKVLIIVGIVLFVLYLIFIAIMISAGVFPLFHKYAA